MTRAVLSLLALWAGLHAAAVITGSRWVFALAVLSLVPLPIVLHARRPRPVDPLEPIWLGAAVFLFAYALVPALEVFRVSPFESLPGHLRLSPPHIYVAAWLSGLGFVAFCLGYFSPLGRRLAARLPSRRSGFSSPLLAAGLVLSAVGLVALEVTLALVGFDRLTPASIASGDMRQATLQAAQGRGYLSLGFLALSLGMTALVLEGARRTAAGTMSRRSLALATLVAIGFAAVAFGVVLGSRSLVIVTTIQLAVALHYGFSRLSARAAAALAVAVASFGVVFISLRNSSTVALDPLLWAGYAGKTFDGFNFLVTAVARQTDMLWGATLGQDLLYTYLPRVLVPDKPTVYGIFTAQQEIIGPVAGPGTYPPGILAEGWVNFGVLGVLVLPFLGALLLRVTYERAILSGGLTLILLGYLLGNQAGFMRGLGAAFAAVVVVSGLLVAAALIGDRIRRHRMCAGFPLAAGLAMIMLAVPVVVTQAVPPPSAQRAIALDRGDIAPLPDRAEAALSTSGGPTALVFWSSWCADCRRQLREIGPISRDGRWTVLGVAYQDTRAGTRAAKARTGASFVDSWDDGRLTLRYGVSQLPLTVLLDSRGRIACSFPGLTPGQRLHEALVSLSTSGSCSRRAGQGHTS